MKDERSDLIAYLETFVTPTKKARMKQVLENRTRYLTVVLEDLFQSHNGSACLRSCECFGIQNVHTIENRYPFQINSEVAMGSSKWLCLHRHNQPSIDNTTLCLENLKAAGYQIVATSLEAEPIPLGELDLGRPTAICFGTEEDGLSPEALRLADQRVKIPMFGFTQSFNISVTVALTLFALTERLHGGPYAWRLNPDEQEAIYLEWLCRSIQRSDLIIQRFQEEKTKRPSPDSHQSAASGPLQSD